MDFTTALIGPRHLLDVKRYRGESHYSDLYEAIESFIEEQSHQVGTDLDLENGTAEVWSDVI